MGFFKIIPLTQSRQYGVSLTLGNAVFTVSIMAEDKSVVTVLTLALKLGLKLERSIFAAELKTFDLCTAAKIWKDFISSTKRRQCLKASPLSSSAHATKYLIIYSTNGTRIHATK